MIAALLYVVLMGADGQKHELPAKHYTNILRCTADAKATVKALATTDMKVVSIACKPVLK